MVNDARICRPRLHKNTSAYSPKQTASATHHRISITLTELANGAINMEIKKQNCWAALGLLASLSLTACSENDDKKPKSESATTPSTPVTLTTPTTSTTPEINVAEDSSRIDTAVEELMSNSLIPGVAVGIVSLESGTPVYWTKGYGVTEVGGVDPITENTSFWMASVSKTVLGTTMMIGQEQGLYSIDQDIRPLLLERSGFSIGDPLNREISLRDLATHTSGIEDTESYACAYYTVNADGSSALAANNLDFSVYTEADCPEPGAIELGDFLAAYLDPNGEYYSDSDNFSAASTPEYSYSNVGAGLAGHFIEVAADVPLANYAQNILFDPMGMTNTFWNRNVPQDISITSQHRVEEGQAIALPAYELATFSDGGLRSSVHDMTRFLALMINDGEYEGVRYIQSASIAEMHTALDSEEEYGLFWEVTDRIQHDGGDPGAATFISFDPETKTGIVTLYNADEFDDPDHDDLVELLFDSAKTLR